MEYAEAQPIGPPIAPLLHRADLYDAVVSGLLIVFLFFFFVGEKIEGLSLPVRIEDFIFILLVPFGYRYLARPKSKLFYWIAAYFAVNLVPYLSQILAGEYGLSFYPIIMVKEMQYFYIAFLVCENRSRWTLGALDILSLAIILNGVRLIYTGEIDYYGIGTFGSARSPSLVGALYLFSTIWVHARSKLLRKDSWIWAARATIAVGFVCVVATISRSSIAAMIMYVFAYATLTHFKAFPLMLAGLGLSVKAIQVLALFGSGVGILAARAVGRAAVATSAAAERSDKWDYYLSTFQPLDLLFGMGKGYPNALERQLGLGVDSQYVRSIMENGLVGIFILTGILWTILSRIYRERGEWIHAWSIILSMMVLSVPLEALQVSKSGGFFWLLLFYLYFCQRKLPQDLRQAS